MSTENLLNILFVDDDQSILDGLKRQCRAYRKVWNTRFALCGADAIAAMEETPVDVLITDMRMPQMSGAELLQIVQERWPGTIRMVLSGQTDQSELLGAVGSIHQYLQKPSNPRQIGRVITRIRELRQALHSDHLSEIVTCVQSLPVLSETYRALMEVLDDPDTSALDIARIVEQDVGLSTKLLQLVNSAFFGLPRPAASIKDAVVVVGIRQVRTLALSAQVFDALSGDCESASLVDRLWRLSGTIGRDAATAAAREGASDAVQAAAQLAGTLSLVGRAMLARSLPDQFHTALEVARAESIDLSEAETRVFGVAQHAIGAYALALWAFDAAIVESVASHTDPGAAEVDTDHPLRYVHLARCQSLDDELADPVTRADAWLAQPPAQQSSTTTSKEAA